MAKAEINVNVITITEDELRKIIREEVRKAVEPGAIRPPYLPPVPLPGVPAPMPVYPRYPGDVYPFSRPVWAQSTGDNTGVSFNSNEVKVERDRPRWAEDVLDGSH